MQHIIKAVQQQ